MDTLKTVTQRVEEWPSGLVTANVLADELGLSEDRILALAEAGYWPHYRFDGGAPQFKKSESRTWAAKHLMQRFEGNDPQIEFKVMVAATGTVQSMPPPSLHGLKGLTELTNLIQPPGVYFLCSGETVVYVGQSKEPLQRIANHRIYKKGKFDRVFFVPVPEFLLNAAERGLIALLKPPLNGNAGPPQDPAHGEIALQLFDDEETQQPKAEQPLTKAASRRLQVDQVMGQTLL
jgi:hypothetical protein